MSVQFTSSYEAAPVKSTRSIENNSIAHHKGAQNIPPELEPGSFNYSNSEFNECLVRKNAFGVNIMGLVSSNYKLCGSINNKGANLSMNKEHGTKAYNGFMGEDNVRLDIKGKNIQGKIGDKKVDLIYKKGMFGKFSIDGKIGDKSIYIKNGTSIKETKGENDIITLVSALKGKELVIKDNNFKAAHASTQKNTDVFSIFLDLISDVFFVFM